MTSARCGTLQKICSSAPSNRAVSLQGLSEFNGLALRWDRWWDPGLCRGTVRRAVVSYCRFSPMGKMMDASRLLGRGISRLGRTRDAAR